jgi:S1-C subfamily serine protease
MLLVAALAILVQSARPSASDPAPVADLQVLESMGRVFRTAYQQAAPAVVLISVTRPRASVRRLLPRFHPAVPEDQPGPQDPGIGSGTVVSPDGYVLSNHHVVDGADSIVVTLADRRSFPAVVVGFDPLIDIALLKIEAAGLPVARLADSDSLQVGDWVLAIGHPLGLGSTLTHGIVSALGRQAQILDDGYGIESFIQTNAAINPGNSGGPLLNLRGEVVGINTAITTRTGYFIGYGLSVPSNLARQAMADLLAHGRVARGYLGVQMREVTQEMARARGLELDRPRGVFVPQVQPDSPASRSGLVDGDLILEVDGQPVDHPNQVQTRIYAKDPGTPVILTLLRQGGPFRVDVVLGERESGEVLDQGRQLLSRLGLEVQEMAGHQARGLGFTGAVAAELGYAPGERAVVVVRVDPDGPAASRGIAVDDVITEIDHQRVTSPEGLARSLARLEHGQSALFWLWRPGQGLEVRALAIPE